MTRNQVVTLFASGALLAVSGVLMAGEPGKTSAAAKTVTFTKDIAPILQNKCEDLPPQRAHGADVAGDLPGSRVPWAKAIKARVVGRTNAAVVHGSRPSASSISATTRP